MRPSPSEELKESYDLFMDLQKWSEKSITDLYKLLFIARANRLENLELILSIKNEGGDMVYFHEGDYRLGLSPNGLDDGVLMLFNMIRNGYKKVAAYNQSIRNFIGIIDNNVREKPELMEDSEYEKYYTLITELCNETSKWPHHRFIEYAKPL